jgi:hypothetical protein
MSKRVREKQNWFIILLTVEVYIFLFCLTVFETSQVFYTQISTFEFFAVNKLTEHNERI